MKKKCFPYVLIGICVCVLIISFIRYQPSNSALVSGDSGNLTSDLSNPSSSSTDTENTIATAQPLPDPEDASTTGDLVIDYLGFGDIKFRVTGIELTNRAPEGNIAQDKSDDYLLVSFELTNLSCVFDSGDEQKLLVNCFSLYATNPPEPYGPQSPWTQGPDYFSDVIDSSDIHSYFQYTLPDVGESGNYTLGWALDSLGLQMLKDNGILLSCSFGGSMPIYYTQSAESTGGAS